MEKLNGSCRCLGGTFDGNYIPSALFQEDLKSLLIDTVGIPAGDIPLELQQN